MSPPRYRDEVRQLAHDIDQALAGFLRGQSAVCLFLGSWYALGLSLIGLNFGFLIGVIAGFLSFIPFVGSITAFVLSIIVALVQGWPDWRLPLEAIAVVSVGLFLDGNVLSPRLVGASVGLHPVWLMFALFAFGALVRLRRHDRRGAGGGRDGRHLALLGAALSRQRLLSAAGRPPAERG